MYEERKEVNNVIIKPINLNVKPVTYLHHYSFRSLMEPPESLPQDLVQSQIRWHYVLQSYSNKKRSSVKDQLINTVFRFTNCCVGK